VVDGGLNISHGIASGDIMGDNVEDFRDLFITIGGTGALVWYENESILGLDWNGPYTIYSDRHSMEVDAADLNGDGRIDAVSNHFPTGGAGNRGRLVVHENLGNGNWDHHPLPLLDARLRQIRLVDIDGDGRLDIVVVGNTSSLGTAPHHTETGLYWYKNNGDMQFTQHFIGKCNAWKVATYDEEGDGHLEIVVSEEFFGGEDSASPCRLLLFKNRGNEVFDPYVIDPDISSNFIPWRGSGVVCHDFDGDGDVDIIGGSYDRGDIYLYRKGSGTGNYDKETIDPNARLFDGIDKCDFDLDGDMDFVACGHTNWISWYENGGNGEFTEHLIDNEWKWFDLPHVTSLNGDSCCDIGVTNADRYSTTGGYVIVYLHHCGSTGIEEESGVGKDKVMKVPSVVTYSPVKIEYSVEEQGKIKLEILDVTGRVVEILEEKHFIQPGLYVGVWDTKEVPPGTYFVKLTSQYSLPIVKKIIVIK
jgi:hypothetical protein